MASESPPATARKSAKNTYQKADDNQCEYFDQESDISFRFPGASVIVSFVLLRSNTFSFRLDLRQKRSRLQERMPGELNAFLTCAPYAVQTFFARPSL